MSANPGLFYVFRHEHTSRRVFCGHILYVPRSLTAPACEAF